MNIYKAGLNNAGSYLVSGKPWLKTSTIADGAIEFYHLPNVAKEITIRNDHQRAGHNLSVAFPEPRRAINMPNSNEDFSTSFSTLGTLTVGFWFNRLASTDDIRIIDLTTAAGVSKVRLQFTSSATKIRLKVNDTTTGGTSGVLVGSNTWHHVVLSIKRGGSPVTKVYIDGVLSITDTTNNPNADMEKLLLGATGTNFDGLYSDCTLFNAELDLAESVALYNGVGNVDPRDHSQAANLVSWWAFEDNYYKNYFDTADTGTTIQDRVGSSNLTIDSGVATFELGRHYASIFNENRSHLLEGAEELTIQAKTVFVAVKCAGGSLDYSIHASLTGIDRSRTQGTGLYD